MLTDLPLAKKRRGKSSRQKGNSTTEENHNTRHHYRLSVSPISSRLEEAHDFWHGPFSTQSNFDGERKSFSPSCWLVGSGALIGEDIMSKSCQAVPAPRGRRKNDLMPVVHCERLPALENQPRNRSNTATQKRSVSMTRLDQLAQPRKHYVEANKAGSTHSSGASSVPKDVKSPKRPLSSASEQSGGSGRVGNSAAVQRVRSSPRKPRPISIAGTGPCATPSASKSPAKIDEKKKVSDKTKDSQGGQEFDDGFGPGDGMDPGFEGYEDSNMEDWNFNNRGGGRGRGGRGHARGIGGMDRWGGPPPDMDRPGEPENQRKTLLPGGPPGNFDGPPDHFDGPPEHFDGPPDGFDRPDRFDGPPDRFDGPPDHFGRPPDRFGGPPNRFDGPPDCFDGPGNRFDKPGGRFGGPPGRRFGGPPGGRFDGPPSGRFDGPRGGRFGAPPGRRFGGPPDDSLDEPSKGSIDGLPSRPSGPGIKDSPKKTLSKSTAAKEPALNFCPANDKVSARNWQLN